MKNIFSLFIVAFFAFNVSAQQSPPNDPLYSGFLSPPNEAKPRVWWHWMNGNITQEGIRKDLDWMVRSGIGGFQNFDANLFTPVVVEEKLVFMAPEWKEAFKLATDLAVEKGLEMAIAGSPGWSVTGGPWVEPKDGMKKYVWSETQITGGKTFQGTLPQPPDVTGKYQEAKIEGGGISGGFIGELPEFYQDAFVIAYKLPETEISLQELNPDVSISGGDFDASKLLDGEIDEHFFLPPMEVGEDMWIQYSFEEAQTFQALGVSGATFSALSEFNGGPENRSLKVSDDGVNFQTIARVSGSTVPFNTVSFPPTSAKYWRMSFETLPPIPNIFAALSGAPMEEPKPDGVNVAEFVLYTTSRIDQIEDKAGFSPWSENGELALNDFGSGHTDAIDINQVINLSDQMKPDGSLIWDAPEGEWMIMRFGYSLTGRQNHPASPEATGLEVDKLDSEAVKRYINHYLDLYKDATGGKLGVDGLQYMILDSYEAGHMNWTENFPAEFQKRRGYPLISYLPALTGRVVGPLEKSEKFLWDFRKTIGEMIADNHYNVIGEELKKRGMKRYTESHENKRIYLADGMDVKRNADIPMSAMWTPGSLAGGTEEEVRSEADIRESASVANIYGKPFVAAESMTSVGKPFQEYPEILKRTADLEMASGVNRFVIHTSVHQPLEDKKPGFSLGPFGQYFTRQETWAEMAKPWMGYLARSSYLLQQGKNVADILYLYGQNTNITWVSRDQLPVIPEGYEFDYVNSTILIEDIEVEGDKLKAPSGSTYEALMLDESTSLMTISVLQKIKKLADDGVRIIGEKPVKSPSLADDNQEFQMLANEIWSRSNVGSSPDIAVKPDVLITETDHKILFKHRRSVDREIYWLNNRSIDPTTATANFRVSGKVPRLWDPITGNMEEVSYEIKDGRTVVPLNFESWDAYFIVFEGEAAQNSYEVKAKTEAMEADLNGDWNVDIAGKTIALPTLSSWHESADAEVKYFSGTATYKTSFNLATIDESNAYELDLGEVKVMAEVWLNGKKQGVVWKTPFRLDITEGLLSGENQLEVKIANSWVNRLIGDAQPGAEKTTFTTMPFYQANSPLVKSGLMGPVKIVRVY
ncbi:glycosyl hydrolase [Algoriphagus sp. D3-2-R+10]|uniref:glycosyl hydrolase n=1 Tax=Algoriphagus aurantiacus TaxID=3103948 RepID=UPI002B3A43CD|nr:glycosyl hydrolase [Algoriphagus sp. D3-2-R+10]MEB2777914.1 glycosyl hydrolase [Algoriphagus sp. D3-2-R+10]